MLVLTRQVSEVICVGETIRIVVVDIRGDNVRLGISGSQRSLSWTGKFTATVVNRPKKWQTQPFTCQFHDV